LSFQFEAKPIGGRLNLIYHPSRDEACLRQR